MSNQDNTTKQDTKSNPVMEFLQGVEFKPADENLPNPNPIPGTALFATDVPNEDYVNKRKEDPS